MAIAFRYPRCNTESIAAEPMAAGKTIRERADAIARASPSFSVAGSGVSLGTIVAIALFGWGLYRIGHRDTRHTDDRPVAAAPVEDGSPLDSKVAAAEGDREADRMLKKPGAAEARQWLDPARHPNHAVYEMGNDRARAMIAGFYERGAKRVSVLAAAPLGDVVVTAVLAIELPDEPDRRSMCLAWEAQYLEGVDPTGDLAQKYLLIMTDRCGGGRSTTNGL
jgi:hypothetical protein